MTTGKLINANPFIAIYDDVFNARTAEAAIAAGQDRLEQPTYGTEEGRVTGEKRTNTAALITQWDVPELTELVTRIADIVRLPPENCETSKLLRYEGEQLFDVHFDGYNREGTSRHLLDRGGQRLFTTLCYLNNVEAGGETAFPNLKVAIRPRLGRVLVFANTPPGSNLVHEDSAHVGFGPDQGVKWVLSMWWRERHFHVPRTFPPTEGDYIVYE